MDKSELVMNLAMKRGFFFPTAEIYNAKAGFWTYGHLGTLMKRKFENLWRAYFLSLNNNYFEIEGNSILPEKVFRGSGHLKNFNDPMTECKKCHFRFRADQLIEDELNQNSSGLSEKEIDDVIKSNKLKCPKCKGELSQVRLFNMMFDVKIGATNTEDIAYLSPETAQNAFLSFKREYFALREKLPMGLAVIGKAYRNEISPRQGFFRLREFTQAELQIFFDPGKINEFDDWDEIKEHKIRLITAKHKKLEEIKSIDLNKKQKLPKFYVYHMAKIQEFYLDILNVPRERFRFRELSENERAFYNKIHFDIEVYFDTLNGFKEIAGLHYRTDHDLKGHQETSKEKMEIVNENKRLMPHVLELSFGVDRNIWMLLDVFFVQEKERTLLRFNKRIAPIEIAVFPLVNKDRLPEKANEVYRLLRKNFTVSYDASGSIGRMYRRVDEIGVPAMITIDYETLEDNTVTIRNRDDMKQIRVNINELNDILERFFNGEKLQKLGNIIK
ncbi:glycine--tRNA ligase [Candidatus Woesearchaeota archaeon]|nr:glycine--tRNA ligase [Candidatus Woesearchaeota archaeon]